MQVLYFFSTQNSQTFDISHAFLPLTIAKLLTFKNVRFFWPTLYNYNYYNYIYYTTVTTITTAAAADVTTISTRGVYIH